MGLDGDEITEYLPSAGVRYYILETSILLMYFSDLDDIYLIVLYSYNLLAQINQTFTLEL
jgi:hypothetical protein